MPQDRSQSRPAPLQSDVLPCWHAEQPASVTLNQRVLRRTAVQEVNMSSMHGTVAGIDVHKKMLVVVILRSANPEVDYATGRFGTTHYALEQLAAFLRQHGVTEVAMESTAQYWRGVWMALEGEFQLTLARLARPVPCADASAIWRMRGALPDTCCQTT